jgi:hypothetical protein
MKLDNYYKFVASTFGFAYFIGIFVGFFYSLVGVKILEQTDYSKLFFLSSSIQFKEIFLTNFFSGVQQMAIPFLYLIESVKQGFLHSSMLMSPFLGQIKLLVQLFPQIFYFVFFIVFSAIGLKIIIYIIKSLTNFFLNKNNKKMLLKVDIFNNNDVLLSYLAIISLIIGVVIQLFLSRIFFIFLINFQLITYIFIILTYAILISLSLYLVYKTILSLLESFNDFSKKIF